MPDLRPISWYLERFPILRRLGPASPSGRIPFVAQMEAADCGAACLAMVLAHHGREVPLRDLRDATGTGRDGVTGSGILEAGRIHGLRGRGLRLENIADLRHLNPGAVLHMAFNHFVVFEALRKRTVEVLDPAVGRRAIPLDQFGREFTGVAIEFEAGDAFQPRALGRRRLWRYLRPVLARRDLLARILTTSVLVQFFALALPILTRLVVDRVVPRGDYHLLWILGWGLASIVLFSFLAAVIRTHLLVHLRTQLDVQLTLGFVDHLMRLPYRFFQKRAVGDLMLRLNSNATIREVVTSSALSGLLDGALVLLYLIIFFATSVPMAFLVLLLGALQALLFIVSRRSYREVMARELEAQARSQSYEVQMLAGIETLKAAGSEDRAVESWSNLFVDVLNVVLARGRLAAWVESVLSGLRMATPLVVLWLGAALVLQERMSLGTMLAVSALAGAFLVPFSTLIGTALQLATIRTYIERIDDVLEEPVEQEGAPVVRAHALGGAITVERVSFRYGPASPLVLREVSAALEPGAQAAIVGRSGSGKSTLARLLIGLYAPTEGRILFDGVDLATLDVRSLRRQIGFVPQDPYLFGLTIRNNIALADPDLPLARVEEAAALAHIDEDIHRLPMGYDTILTDGGRSLSGGQRQRIALARALVGRPRIVVLDEATSDLDTITESLIQRELARLRCTLLIIAHRLNTVAHADAILVLEQGRLVEQGTHESLLSLQGTYAGLVAAQSELGRAPGPVPGAPR